MIQQTQTPQAKSVPPQATANHKSLGYSFMGVEIEINHDCNRACKYCPNSVTQRKSQGQMTESQYRSIMTQLQAINYKGRISYHFYNEPLLSPNLDLFVQLTKEYLPESWIEIYTNGTLLTDEKLRKLIALGVDKFTVTRHHGLKDFPFDDLVKTLEPEVRKRIRYQSYRDLFLLSRGGIVRVGYIKEKPPLPVPCFIPTSVLVITVTGNVVPCFEDYHEQNVMGNVFETPLSEIWKSDKYVRFRTDLKNNKRADQPVCRDCNCKLMFV